MLNVDYINSFSSQQHDTVYFQTLGEKWNFLTYQIYFLLALINYIFDNDVGLCNISDCSDTK